MPRRVDALLSGLTKQLAGLHEVDNRIPRATPAVLRVRLACHAGDSGLLPLMIRPITAQEALALREAGRPSVLTPVELVQRETGHPCAAVPSRHDIPIAVSEVLLWLEQHNISRIEQTLIAGPMPAVDPDRAISIAGADVTDGEDLQRRCAISGQVQLLGNHVGGNAVDGTF